MKIPKIAVFRWRPSRSTNKFFPDRNVVFADVFINGKNVPSSLIVNRGKTGVIVGSAPKKKDVVLIYYEVERPDPFPLIKS